MLLAEVAAQRVAKQFGSEPWKIARSIDLPIFRRELPDGVRELYFQAGSGPGAEVAMVIANDADPREARELLAHGLGHHFLHAGNRIGGSLRPLWSGRLEREADDFAACLLLPAEPIRKALAQPDPPSLWELAETFDVQVPLIERRTRLIGHRLSSPS